MNHPAYASTRLFNHGLKQIYPLIDKTLIYQYIFLQAPENQFSEHLLRDGPPQNWFRYREIFLKLSLVYCNYNQPYGCDCMYLRKFLQYLSTLCATVIWHAFKAHVGNRSCAGDVIANLPTSLLSSDYVITCITTLLGQD